MPGNKSKPIKKLNRNVKKRQNIVKPDSSVKRQKLQLPDYNGMDEMAKENSEVLKESSQVSVDCENGSPSSVFEWLIFPHRASDFFSTYWEKQPLLIQTGHSKATRHEELFTKDTLLQLLKDKNLKFAIDLNVSRFLNDKWESLNKTGRFTPAQFRKLFENMGATMQFHHPQRFVPKLWAIMEKLESYFGCLVGANVYLTPRGCQGLAPHYDDVEVFVLQLEGEKQWTLCKPPVPLAREYKTNLTAEEIGSPTHKFHLKPGDVLYMPRGTVHQANTPSTYNGHSTHITFSTYQKHTWGDYMLHAFPKLLEAAIDNCTSLRQGLPVGFISKSVMDWDFLRSLLQELPKHVTSLSSELPFRLMQDFMTSRLPPFGLIRDDIINASPEGLPPNLESCVRLTYPDHISFALSDGDGEEIGEEAEDKGSSNPPVVRLFVFTSIFNNRSHHMMKTSASEDSVSNILKFPSFYDKAMKQLLAENEIAVKHLNLLSNRDKLQLVTTLWSLHLLQANPQ